MCGWWLWVVGGGTAEKMKEFPSSPDPLLFLGHFLSILFSVMHVLHVSALVIATDTYLL